ncbi:hypothetical protein [Sphingomonas sp.]|jgi:hypothetical protein|uniref:hypothetical protein n=1 Tax=Sphingomonas sp. TaxID=28214 RepID=UPI002E33CA37|nr:hypothetical protein [Sphingomonas sp.]HEX4694798.1 hypothetical protein [Sphingomonas sp.]
MKILLAAAAAAFAMPAIAQDTPAAPPAAPMAQTAPSGSMTMGPAMPVVQPLPDTATADTGPVPMCSKTVVDHCMERSNARGQRLHTTPRPPGA